MPSKKKKYNARFPAGRIKKIMQSDEEIGKVAQAVPVIISRTLELFVESLLTKTLRITNSRNAKTLSTSHLKQCIMSEQRFDFLRELVKNIPDISVAEDEAAQSSPEDQYPDSDTPYDLSMPSTSQQARTQPSNGNSMIASSGNSLRLSGPNNGNNIANPVNYSKRSSTSASVIMHTTSLANANSNVNNSIDGPPPKLARSESTPAHMSTAIAPKGIWRPIDAPYTQQRKRLKQLSQSMPQYGSSTSTCSNSNTINNNINSIPKTTQPIPAPIVNFDYCTKPIVKIDYTNLTTTKTTCVPATSTAPLSAPVLGHHSNPKTNALNSAFDFGTAAPIINIDLSNMMAPASTGSTQATISIGALPLKPTKIALPVTEKQSPLNAININTTSATSVGSKSNALFELDEDYDNI